MDPRHQTPERLAEQARHQRFSRQVGALVGGGLVAFLCLWSTLPALVLGLTADLVSAEGEVISSVTKVRPSVPSRPDGTTCIAIASYTVKSTRYETEVTSGCPDRGDLVTVQYDRNDPATARTQPTLGSWFELAIGLAAFAAASSVPARAAARRLLARGHN